MRDFLEEIVQRETDPVEAARRTMRPLRKRFYESVAVADGEGGFAVRLDGRAVRTPARRLLAAPQQAIAEAIAAEWLAVGEYIDPALMPLTRLANSIIDGVADQRQSVADEIGKYVGGDMLFYRSEGPDGLVAAQARHWDPVIDWARDDLGARFILSEGVVFVAQPERAIAAARTAIPDDAWRLGALHSVTTLTGSGLLGLALARGRLTASEAWAAAHVDEDWNMAQWGRDELALQRRDQRWSEMQAAATVLEALRPAV